MMQTLVHVRTASPNGHVHRTRSHSHMRPAASCDVKDGPFLMLVVANVSFTEFLQQDKTTQNEYRRKY